MFNSYNGPIGRLALHKWTNYTELPGLKFIKSPRKFKKAPTGSNLSCINTQVKLDGVLTEPHVKRELKI